MFIRFGLVPKNERSKIFKRGKPIGFEKGVSVYDCAKIRGKYLICLPYNCKECTVDSIHGCLLNHNISGQKVFLVDGRIMGYVSDNDPLIKNVKILKEIEL